MSKLKDRVLTNGDNVIIQNRNAQGQDTPVYPITKTTNVYNAEGKDVDTIIEEAISGAEYIPTDEKGAADGVATLDSNSKVPTSQLPTATSSSVGAVRIVDGVESTDTTAAGTAAAVKTAYDKAASAETAAANVASDLDTFINTTAPATYVEDSEKGAASGVATLDANSKVTATQLPTASSSVAGVVTLSDSTSSADSTVAASTAAVKSAYDKAAGVETALANYVPLSQKGVANGVATLDANAKIPEAQLPSYVDDIIEGYYDATTGKFYKDSEKTQEITPESGKIYVSVDTNITYRWSGTQYTATNSALALGETDSTAYRGDRGKIAYDHSQSAHARVDATKVEAPVDGKNGYITIDGVDALVYEHPGTGTNPHGTTASDVGLGNVENKDSATIRSEITSSNVTTALGYTPQDASSVATTSTNGVMASSMVTKLNALQPVVVSSTSPTFPENSGIWFQVVQ